MQNIIEKNAKMNNVNWIKRILTILLVFILCVIGLFIYIHFNTFDIAYKEESIEEFILKGGMDKLLKINNNRLSIELPENVMSTEMKKVIAVKNSNEGLAIQNLAVDITKSEIYIDANYKGFNLPLNVSYTLEQTDTNLLYYFEDVSLTKQGIKIPTKLQNKFFDLLGIYNKIIIVKKENYIKTFLINNFEVKQDDHFLQIELSVNESLYNTQLKRIKNNLNPAVVYYYEVSGDEIQKKALDYIGDYQMFALNDTKRLLVDLYGEAKLFKSIIMLSDQETFEVVSSEYGQHWKEQSTAELLDEQTAIMTKVLSVYSEQIFKAADVYFHNDRIYINNGQPYSYLRKKIVAVKDIVEFYDINMTDELLKSFSFLYNSESESLFLIYPVSSSVYLASDAQGMVTTVSDTTIGEWKNSSEAGPVKGEYNAEIFGQIRKLILEKNEGEGLYIRYLKYDNQHVFAVVSDVENYQEPVAYAFERTENGYELIAEDIKDIKAFNQKHRHFNIDLALDELENVVIKKLGSTTIKVIYEDLVIRGIIEEDDDVRIVYCSYGGNYITLKLSDDSEYIYKMFNNRLYDVKPKTEALAFWDDVPEIITLVNEEN